ncbi:RNA-binding S4 domain-containing protein [Marinobacter hydrocarbonoclasticus]|nr:RNA-binding S4 domain-containing protein [Marinobacter nauticus]
MSTSVLELHPGDEFIELYKVLKIEGWVGSGSEAKMLIAEGEVLVNHEVETRKRRKLVAGDNVIFGDEAVLIQASSQPAPKAEAAPKPAKPKRRPSLKF